MESRARSCWMTSPHKLEGNPMHMGRDTHASGNSGMRRDQSLGSLVLKKLEIIF